MLKWLGISLIAVGILVVMFLIDLKQQEADQKENKSKSLDYIYLRNENHTCFGGTNLDRFYVECILANCISFKDEGNTARAKFLADKYNLSYDEGIEKLFDKAKEKHQEIANSIKDRELAEERAKEIEKFNTLNRYSECIGIEKPRAMLNDQIEILKKPLQDAEKSIDALYKMGIQKEKDWAILGGIADGLAGPAAGVATAVNVQRQNELIREQNAAHRMEIARLKIGFKDSPQTRKILSKIEKLEKEVSDLPEKMIDKRSSEEIMKLLDITDSSLTISNTGAFTVKAKVQVLAGTKCTIFGNVPARIDGTLAAYILEDGKPVETALLSLPVYGIQEKQKPKDIIGMGIPETPLTKGKEYTIHFEPYKLWMIEI